jgi:hypothetical protein
MRRFVVEDTSGYDQTDSGRTNATFISNCVDRKYPKITYKKPKVNITAMLPFCGKGSYSYETCQIGKINIAMSMAVWTRVVPKKNFLSSMAQYPPALESQNASTGTQWNIPIKI